MLTCDLVELLLLVPLCIFLLIWPQKVILWDWQRKGLGPSVEKLQAATVGFRRVGIVLLLYLLIITVRISL